MINSTRMNSPNTLFASVILVFHILFCFISFIKAQPIFNARVCQDTFGNYTSNSKYKENLDELLLDITSNTQIDYGFYNFSVGHGMDRVNGIGLCMRGLSVTDCQICLKDASERIVVECPTQKDAIGWYDQCMIRYSDRYIFGKVELGPWYYLEGTFYGIDKERFNQTASTLLARLQKEASSSMDSRYKFAVGEANVTKSRTIYALVQCTPDLDAFDCYYCLENAIAFSLDTDYGRQARVFYTSCNIRYETYLFYNATGLEQLRHSPPPPSIKCLPFSVFDDPLVEFELAVDLQSG